MNTFEEKSQNKKIYINSKEKFQTLVSLNFWQLFKALNKKIIIKFLSIRLIFP